MTKKRAPAAHFFSSFSSSFENIKRLLSRECCGPWGPYYLDSRLEVPPLLAKFDSEKLALGSYPWQYDLYDAWRSLPRYG